MGSMDPVGSILFEFFGDFHCCRNLCGFVCFVGDGNGNIQQKSSYRHRENGGNYFFGKFIETRKGLLYFIPNITHQCKRGSDQENASDNRE